MAAVKLGTGRTALAISTGIIHACAVLDDTTLKCWGNNEFGQLGLGDTADRGDEPGEMGANLAAVNLGTGRSAAALSAGGAHIGEAHTCALLDNGTVDCWGFNSSGRLGQGDLLDRGARPGEMVHALPIVDLGTQASTIGGRPRRRVGGPGRPRVGRGPRPLNHPTHDRVDPHRDLRTNTTDGALSPPRRFVGLSARPAPPSRGTGTGPRRPRGGG